MVKLPDEIKIENCLFISKYVNNKLPLIFDSWFIFSSTSHNYETLFATKCHLKIPTDTTTTYGKEAFTSMDTKAWNNIQSQIKDPMVNTFSPNKLKIILFGISLSNQMLHCFFLNIGRDNISFGCFFLLFKFFFNLLMTAKSFWLFGYQLTCSK